MLAARVPGARTQALALRPHKAPGRRRPVAALCLLGYLLGRAGVTQAALSPDPAPLMATGELPAPGPAPAARPAPAPAPPPAIPATPAAAARPQGPGYLEPLDAVARRALDSFPPGPDEKPYDVHLHFLKSNERRHDLFFSALRGLGGGYIGVGADQNYTLAAAAGAQVVWLVDIDGHVIDWHRIYCALVPAAPTPGALLALLGGGRDEDVKKALAARWDAAEAKRLWPLYLHYRYYLHTHLTGERQIKRRGQPTTWLSDPALYQRVRALMLDRRVVARVGDLHGESTLLGIARVASTARLLIRTVYLSNVEQWFRYSQQFQRNLATLPHDGRTVVLRTLARGELPLPDEDRWHFSVQLLDDFVRMMRTGEVVRVQGLMPAMAAARRPGAFGLSFLGEVKEGARPLVPWRVLPPLRPADEPAGATPPPPLGPVSPLRPADAGTPQAPAAQATSLPPLRPADDAAPPTPVAQVPPLRPADALVPPLAGVPPLRPAEAAAPALSAPPAPPPRPADTAAAALQAPPLRPAETVPGPAPRPGTVFPPLRLADAAVPSAPPATVFPPLRLADAATPPAPPLTTVFPPLRLADAAMPPAPPQVTRFPPLRLADAAPAPQATAFPLLRPADAAPAPAPGPASPPPPAPRPPLRPADTGTGGADPVPPPKQPVPPLR